MNFRDRGPGVKFAKDKIPLPDLFITIAIAAIVATIFLLFMVVPTLMWSSEKVL